MRERHYMTGGADVKNGAEPACWAVRIQTIGSEWLASAGRGRSGVRLQVATGDGGDSVTAYAERQGLFVIRATGNSASIVNAEDFELRSFA